MTRKCKRILPTCLRAVCRAGQGRPYQEPPNEALFVQDNQYELLIGNSWSCILSRSPRQCPTQLQHRRNIMAVTAHQTWSPEQYAQQARFVSDLGMPVVELLAPRAGERILDLGCGDGSLTKKLVELGCQVVGVDASPPWSRRRRRWGWMHASWMGSPCPSRRNLMPFFPMRLCIGCPRRTSSSLASGGL